MCAHFQAWDQHQSKLTRDRAGTAVGATGWNSRAWGEREVFPEGAAAAAPTSLPAVLDPWPEGPACASGVVAPWLAELPLPAACGA